MKIHIQPKPNDAKRILIYLPAQPLEWSKKIRQFADRIWHPHENAWSIPKHSQTIKQLKQVFGQHLVLNFPQSNLATTPPSNRSYQNSSTIPNYSASKPKNHSGSIIRIDLENARWLKVQVPYFAKGWICLVKSIPGRTWNPEDKRWRVPYVQDSLSILQSVGAEFLHFSFQLSTHIPESINPPSPLVIEKPIRRLPPQHELAVTAFEERLMLERKSWRTIKSYKHHLIDFFSKNPQSNPIAISSKQIQNYLIQKIEKHHIAESTQNQIINALKAYFERVLDQKEKVQFIPRPKKAKQLPNVLSPKEVESLINSIANLKHKTMISLIYSAGLRKSELLKLRLKDLIIHRNCIFVKSAKGKKDRFVSLAPTVLNMIRSYRKIYYPRYWLFEGQKGGPYSESSLQNIFNTAKIRSGVNPYVTLHGLRHSYATHLVEQGTSLKAVKDLLGHHSIKTTELYLHLSNEYLNKIPSPIERLNLHQFSDLKQL